MDFKFLNYLKLALSHKDIVVAVFP